MNENIENNQNKELRAKIRNGYFFGLGAIFLIPMLLFMVPAALTGQPVTLNGEPSTWWKVLPLMLVMFPVILFLQGLMISYAVTFGLWVQSKLKAK